MQMKNICHLYSSLEIFEGCKINLINQQPQHVKENNRYLRMSKLINYTPFYRFSFLVRIQPRTLGLHYG